MKQHITKKQLEEIAVGDTLLKLDKWMTENDYHGLLTIGQMIEFLDENKSPLAKGIIYKQLDEEYMTCKVAFVYLDKKRKINCLVDALWEAVKEILEK